MMVVIGTFFFCNIFSTIIAMRAEADGKNGTHSNLFVSISDLFLTLNCSINMAIYGIFGQKFRRTFRKLFFPCWKYEPDQLPNYPIQSETRWSPCALNSWVMWLNSSLVLLLISNLTNELRLHQFLLTKTTVANKSLKTDANGAH